jgi:hypothetical protein
MKTIVFIAAILVVGDITAQQKSYYYQIPDTPTHYSAATVAARMIDGLGFRYYWATEGLTNKDLSYRPSPGARTTLETLEHIHGLTEVLFNTVSKKTTTGAAAKEKQTFTQLREQTLKNIQLASELLKQANAQPQEMDMLFDRPNGKTRFPFWNLINGPAADALWHVGQVVSFRRASGNPIPEGVNVLTGNKIN